jgi:SAM-dependent methyltransferase
MAVTHGHAHQHDRARSFGGAADAYDRLRPAPSPEALAWVLPPGTSRVLDLGAGTGLVSRALVAAGVADVVAVEPDDRMRAHLAASSPGVRALAGTAEEIPVPDGTVDAVLAASAWHWFDPERATAEIARVLRPGGVLGLLWSYADPATPWVAAARAVGRVEQHGSGPLAASGFAVELPPGAPFGPGETHRFPRTAPMSREDIAGMVGTYSSVLTLPPAEQDDVRRRVRALLDEHPGIGDADPVEVPFTTTAWRSVRR